MADPDYREIKERAAPGLLELPGVHGVAIGGKVTAGARTGQTAIAVFVDRKLPLSEVPEAERIPSEIDGVPTDVLEAPPMRALAAIPRIPGIPATTKRDDDTTYRPLRGGIRIRREGAPSGDGTLGCLCTVAGDPKRVMALTNHHVVFLKATETAAGELCGQPHGNSSSTRSCNDIVGTLVDALCDPFVDIALIQLKPGMQWLAEIEGDGVITGTRALSDDEAISGTVPVKKRGAMSGLTGGVVTHFDLEGDMLNEDNSVHHHYKHQLRIRANPDPLHAGPTEFGLHGDSGSVVRDMAGKVIGILIAAGGGEAAAFPIQTLLDTFKTGVPEARRLELQVATATTPGAVRTVPAAAMAADEAPALAPLSWQDAQEIEDELRTSRQGAWYADLYRRHADETAALVHTHRRVAVVWHRSGAAELFQWIWRAFTNPELRIPDEIQGRPARACLQDLAAALERNGSPNLTADVGRVLAVLPDVAGLTQREILERLKTAEA